METDLNIIIQNKKDIHQNTDWEIYTDNGWKDFYGIKKSSHDKTIKFIFKNNSIVTTLSHKFKMVDGKYKRASELLVGDLLWNKIRIKEIIYQKGEIDVYDILGVEDTKTYYTNGVISHNCAFIPQINDIWTSAYPGLSKGGSSILISTPNGVSNFFYKTYYAASKACPKSERNQFVSHFVHWTQIPEYRDFEDTTGMTFKEIVEKAKQGKWYKFMRSQFTDREWAQEFEGDFLGSGNTLVSPDVLRQAKDSLEDPILTINRFWQEDPNGELWIWKKPTKGHQYIIGADISSGTGSDWSACQVLDMVTGEQVAELKSKMNTMEYAKYLVELAQKYNTALLIPEVTGLGFGVVQKIVYEIGYENIFQTINETTMKKKKSSYGWHTSGKTRPLLESALIAYFNSMEFKWRSRRLWDELSGFVWKDNGKAEAETGMNDDLVMAYAMAAHNRGNAFLQMPIDMQHTLATEAGYLPGEVDEFGEVPMTPEEKNNSGQDKLNDVLNPIIEPEDKAIIDWLRS